MEDLERKLKKEQVNADRNKAIIPNFVRLFANITLLNFIPDPLILFKTISWTLTILSLIWTVSEFLVKFNYLRFKILPYIPAFLDMISIFILIYLTGSGNSAFSGMLVCNVVVSSLFSPKTSQPVFLLIVSLVFYFLLLLGLYFDLFPYVNLMNFDKNKNIFLYIFAFSFLSIMIYGIFNSVRFIGKANFDLNEKLKELIVVAETEKNRSEKLLLNILPFEVAQELKDKGSVKPVLFDNVTILFTDFKGFTKIAEKMPPKDLIETLDASFTQFDKIVEKYKLEKLKTIGDSYMCAAGLPVVNSTHHIDASLASLELNAFMKQIKELKISLDSEFWEIRIGIHCGPVIAGVIGEKKFTYDIWGDAVNTASRLESSGVAGEINISKALYEKVQNFFLCEYRGKISAKNKGEVDMYFLQRIRPELSFDEFGLIPNEKFMAMYQGL